MTKIYRRRHVPTKVCEWFEHKFPNEERKTYTFEFYTYDNGHGVTIYGCEVYLNGKYYSNADQYPLEWYENQFVGR